MKIRFELAILVILVTSIFLSAPTPAELNLTADGEPPAPEFVSMTPDKSLYINGTSNNVTVEYRADRFDVEGLILLGTGSNLSLSYDDGLMMNLSRTYKQWAYYTTNITVSENTRFYAWAWHTSHDNGTEEVYQEDFFELKGHHVFSNNSEYLPYKESISNTTISSTDWLSNSDYVALTNASITIKYTIENDAEDNTLKIALVSNLDEVLDAELEDMVLENKDEFNTTTYNYTLTFEQPELYFSVKSAVGWDISRINEEWRLDFYRITAKGISFNSTTASHFENQTNIATMTLNVTLYNSSDYTVGLFYRNYNDSVETNDSYPVWEKINGTLIDEYSYEEITDYLVNVNVTINESTGEWAIEQQPFNATTIVKVYSAEIGLFENDTTVEYYSFAEYGGYFYNESKRTVEIQSSIPYATISASEYYYRETEVTFSLTTETSTGSEIVELSIKAENVTYDLDVDEDSYDYSFTAEGIHTVYLNVTNSLNYSYIAETEVLVDHTTPTLNIVSQINGTTIDSSYVMLELSYSDSLADIEEVTVDWGDGTAIYVEGTIVDHEYGASGNYTITITVKDKSGNEVTEVLIVTINIVEEQTKDDAPIMGIVTILGIMSSIVYTRQKRRN